MSASLWRRSWKTASAFIRRTATPSWAWPPAFRLRPEDKFSVTYYAPQPRAVLRVVNPKDTTQVVPYGQWGRVELTTLTREFFMPRFLERDEAIRREPRPPYAWDGVAEVRPFGAMEKDHRRRSLLKCASIPAVHPPADFTCKLATNLTSRISKASSPG